MSRYCLSPSIQHNELVLDWNVGSNQMIDGDDDAFLAQVAARVVVVAYDEDAGVRSTSGDD